MKYHLVRGETQLGVWTIEELIVQYNSGSILNSDLIWRNQMPEWISFGEWLAGSEGIDFQNQAKSRAPLLSENSHRPPQPPSMPPRPQPFPAVPVQRPSNYLAQSILVTLFCCIPFGIVSIVYAAQVDSKFHAGDYAGAQKSSDSAKLWAWIAFGVGLVGILSYFGLMGIVMGDY